MYKVYEVDDVKGVAEVVKFFESYAEAEEWAASMDTDELQYVVCEPDEEFCWC